MFFTMSKQPHGVVHGIPAVKDSTLAQCSTKVSQRGWQLSERHPDSGDRAAAQKWCGRRKFCNHTHPIITVLPDSVVLSECRNNFSRIITSDFPGTLCRTLAAVPLAPLRLPRSYDADRADIRYAPIRRYCLPPGGVTHPAVVCHVGPCLGRASLAGRVRGPQFCCFHGGYR